MNGKKDLAMPLCSCVQSLLVVFDLGEPVFVL